MPKCDSNKVAKEVYGHHTLAWIFSCKFAPYFQHTFSLRTPLDGCFCKWYEFMKFGVKLKYVFNIIFHFSDPQTV